ncbi:putative nuclease HARBI1 [Prorops nasuta]|uniref:putative nuclease HARBI1 n=1 Tax=Prorops nasuta TaxID=863751 RepID=UPI0034CFFA24
MLPVNIINYQIIDELERRKQINGYNLERKVMRQISDPFSLRDEQFKSLFRLTKDMVHYLMDELIPHLHVGYHAASITPELRIFFALYFFATGSYQRTIGQSFNISMSQQSVSNAIKEVSELISKYLTEEWIIFPTEATELNKKKSRFMRATNFPGTIGAVDCTHINIIGPPIEKHNYLNRKGQHSKNVQIVCDYDLNILSINPRYGGAAHDAFIWNHSIICEHLETQHNMGNHNIWLIGDSGYPQQPWLMTPVPGERTLRYNPARVGQIIIACSVLHNICNSGKLSTMINRNSQEFNIEEADIIEQTYFVSGNSGLLAKEHLINNYFA